MRVAIVFLWACLAATAADKPDRPHAKGESAEPKPTLELLPGWKFQQERYSGSISGSVRNNSERPYKYVKITFNLFDSSGVQVGSTSASLSDFDGHGVWKFKALVLEEQARTCRLKELSGF